VAVGEPLTKPIHNTNGGKKRVFRIMDLKYQRSTKRPHTVDILLLSTINLSNGVGCARRAETRINNNINGINAK